MCGSVRSKISQRGKERLDFQNMVDTGDTGQGIANSRTLVFILRPDLDMIPVTNDGKRLIIVF